MFRYEKLKNIGRNHPDGPAFFSYSTDETLAQVAVAGYFSDSRAELVPGDMVLVKASDGTRLFTAKDSTSCKLDRQNFIYVDEKDDLPDAVSGAITLLDSYTYFFTTEIDLEGDRIICGANTVILGPSSENARIKSTGLAQGTALITSEWSLPIRHITFEAETIFDLDATANANQALDWFGVNLVSGDIGTVKNYSNFVVTSMAFLDASGLIFDGTIGTIAFSDTLFNGTDGTIITLPATLTVTRRFRISYSSIIVPSGQTGIDVSTSATIPVEGYIYDTCNFSGAGTYTTGVAYNDNKARWTENRGVINSAALTGYHMFGNATATTIAATETPVKVAGATIENAISQRFTVTTSNRATYAGAIDRNFKVSAILTVTSGPSNQVGMYIAKNGTVLDESETYVTTGASGRLENGACQVLTNLSDGDYIEIFVENNTAITDVTVEDMSVIIESLN